MHGTHTHKWLLLALVFISFTLLGEESRLWQNDKGKTIKGRLVIQDETHAKIRSDKNGKIYTIAIDRLCPDEQFFLQNQLVSAAVDDDILQDSTEVDAGAIAKLLALGLAAVIGVALGVIVVSILIQSLFLHMATRMLSLQL